MGLATPVSSTDHAWAAGFFDGEGSLSIAQPSPRVIATQVRREPLDRLAQIYGGTVIRRPRTNGWQPIHVWTLSGAARVETCLLAMLPYLTVKRPTAQVTLAFCARLLAFERRSRGFGAREAGEDEGSVREALRAAFHQARLTGVVPDLPDPFDEAAHARRCAEADGTLDALPGTRADVARACGVTPEAVHARLQRLMRLGVVTRVREGRAYRYHAVLHDG